MMKNKPCETRNAWCRVTFFRHNFCRPESSSLPVLQGLFNMSTDCKHLAAILDRQSMTQGKGKQADPT